MWINQPSTLQPFHKLHSKRVLMDEDFSRFKGNVIVYFIEGDTISQMVSRLALSNGWPATSHA